MKPIPITHHYTAPRRSRLGWIAVGLIVAGVAVGLILWRMS